MFCLGDGCVCCSNFAPLYDIPEECATGTSNGALTYYLYRRGLVRPGEETLFMQGEHMHRPSRIRSRLHIAPDGGRDRPDRRSGRDEPCGAYGHLTPRRRGLTRGLLPRYNKHGKGRCNKRLAPKV